MEHFFISNSTPEYFFVENIFQQVLLKHFDYKKELVTLFKKGGLEAFRNQHITFKKNDTIPVDFEISFDYIPSSFDEHENMPSLICNNNGNDTNLCQNTIFIEHYEKIALLMKEIFSSMPNYQVINKERIKETLDLLQSIENDNPMSDVFFFAPNVTFVDATIAEEQKIPVSIIQNKYDLGLDFLSGRLTVEWEIKDGLPNPTTGILSEGILSEKKQQKNPIGFDKWFTSESITDGLVKNMVSFKALEGIKELQFIYENFDVLEEHLNKVNIIKTLTRYSAFFHAFNLNMFLLEEQKELLKKMKNTNEIASKEHTVNWMLKHGFSYLLLDVLNTKLKNGKLIESKLNESIMGKEKAVSMYIEDKEKNNIKLHFSHYGERSRLLFFDTDFLNKCFYHLSKDFPRFLSQKNLGIDEKFITQHNILEKQPESFKQNHCMKSNRAELMGNKQKNEISKSLAYPFLNFMYCKAKIETDNRLTEASLISEKIIAQIGSGLDNEKKENLLTQQSIKTREQIVEKLREMNKFISSNFNLFTAERLWKQETNRSSAFNFLRDNDLLSCTIPFNNKDNKDIVGVGFMLSSSFSSARVYLIFRKELRNNSCEKIDIEKTSKEILSQPGTIKILDEMGYDNLIKLQNDFYETIKLAAKKEIIISRFLEKVTELYPAEALQFHSEKQGKGIGL